MIVWLSSYPRSGNTLLRTVLKRCMGLDSYADEPLLIQSAVFSDAQYVGHRELPATWPEFYAAATAAPEVALVKTHLPPRDEQPFIYVVRDGRSAVRSYRKYYEKYLPDHRASIYQIIAGDDAYGHWTSHYRAWMGRGAPVMLVRYEELLNIGPELLARIAEFVGHAGPVTPWTNPFESLAHVEPGFFREGSERFVAGPDWPALAELMFAYFHSELMGELGYDLPPGAAGADLSELFGWAQGLVRRNRELGAACDERLALINRLNDECEKRLEIINRFTQQAGTAR